MCINLKTSFFVQHAKIFIFVFLIYTEFEIVLAQETKNQNSFPYSKEDIENLVEKYLLKTSEIIIKALDTCKRPQHKTEKKGIQRALKQNFF